ncbi:hypothetical protein AVEN_104193-1 [Araneus ventricosus]|uniref:Uncharacterized protein n=1 Tax=Araneus ventricosus TaxID=182803 RepID=A0A4Y2JQS5_ARAVE|nr:hypothetical protein AVEN_104193-1 [Araneus ventricosus]
MYGFTAKPMNAKGLMEEFTTYVAGGKNLQRLGDTKARSFHKSIQIIRQGIEEGKLPVPGTREVGAKTLQLAESDGREVGLINFVIRISSGLVECNYGVRLKTKECTVCSGKENAQS